MLTASTAPPGVLTAAIAPLGALTASDGPGLGVAGLLDEAAMPVLSEAAGFILGEDGT